MRQGTYPITYDAELRAPVITPTDFGADNNTDPWTTNSRTFGLPDGLDESILMPLILEQWFGSTWCSDRRASKSRPCDADLVSGAGAGWRGDDCQRLLRRRSTCTNGFNRLHFTLKSGHEVFTFLGILGTRESTGKPGGVDGGHR